MVFTVAVLFRGQFAYYKVYEQGERYHAGLVRYNGKGERPPRRIAFQKQGRHCTGTADVALMNDLWDAVHQTKKGGGLLVVLNP